MYMSLFKHHDNYITVSFTSQCLLLSDTSGTNGVDYRNSNLLPFLEYTSLIINTEKISSSFYGVAKIRLSVSSNGSKFCGLKNI